MSPAESLGEELRSVVGDLVRSTRVVDTLSPNRAAALGWIEREGPQTIAQLAERCGIRHQSMTTIVAQLDAVGAVTRAPHPVDGRAMLVTVTPAGAASLVADRRRRAGHLDAAIAERLDETERARLEDAIGLLRRLATDTP